MVLSPTAIRWLEIALYSTIAAVAATAVLVTGYDGAGFVAGWASRVEDSGRIGVGLSAIVPAVAIFAACAPSALGRPVGFLGIRHWRRYPPLWVAVVAAWILAIGALHLWSEPTVRALDLWSQMAPPLASAAVGYTLAAGYAWIAATPDAGNSVPPGRPRQNIADLNSDIAKMKHWLDGGDHHLTSSGQALFDFSASATELAELLSPTRGAPIESIALVGPQGSGKTTLFHLAQEASGDNPRLRWHRISAWDYLDVQSLIRAILELTVSAIGQEVSIVGIKSIPNRYIHGIRIDSDGTLLSMLRFLHEPFFSPGTQLRRLSNILTAIDMHIVIAIDDLERVFAPGSQQDGAHGLYSLLLQLREMPRVTPVFSVAR